MLQRMHDSVGQWVAGVILGLIAIAFVFWGVDFSMNTTTFAAKVNGEDIPLAEFDRELQAQQNQYQQLYRIELSEDLRRELRRNTIERMVAETALRQRIEKSGYRVSDERVQQHIMSFPAFQVGNEFSLDVYRGLLANQGLTPRMFEEMQREQLALLDFQRGIADSTFFTPAEFRRYIELYHQRREIGYALFEVERFSDRVTIDEDAITAHYESNQSSYQTDETVDLEYVELSQADIAATIDVSEDALRRYYERERERFETVEERRVSHILVNLGDDPDAARAKAEQAAARVNGGEDFAAVAAEMSDDAGTKSLGGSLGWISRGMLAGPFEDALFDMQVGEVRGPVQSDFGLHVIRLDEIRPGEIRPFEDVVEELRAEYQTREAEDQFFDRANALADAAFDAYNELESVAASTGLPLKTIDGFSRTGDSLAFPNPAAVVQAAFDPDVLETGRNSQLVELSEDHVLVLRVKEHHPPVIRPLEEVREEIEQELIRIRAQELAAEAAQAFLDALSENAEADPVALAETHNGTWTAPAWVERSDANVPSEALAAAFSMPTPAEGQPIRELVTLASGNRAVVVLSGVQPGQPEAITQEERDRQRRELADRSAIAEITSYAEAVRNKATVRIPEEVLRPQL